MAQVPRGEPRSVPDPAGEKYDAMIRRERLARQGAEGAPSRSPLSFDATPFSPSDTLDAIRKAPRFSPTVTVGGRTYREIDNGRANVLVPVIDPLHSLAVRAEQRGAVERASFMAGHPMAGAAYGVAALFGASPGARDGALMAGSVLDAAMLGAAPRGIPIRSALTAPQRQPLPPTLQRPQIRYQDLNERGQATGVHATLTPPLLGTGSKAYWRLKPPGWQGNGNTFTEDRGHLVGRQLGGTGRDMRNLVTLTRRPANSPHMSTFEDGAARRTRAGEVIEYAAMPFYQDGILPPSAILLTAFGSSGPPTARLVLNRAGQKK